MIERSERIDSENRIESNPLNLCADLKIELLIFTGRKCKNIKYRYLVSEIIQKSWISRINYVIVSKNILPSTFLIQFSFKIDIRSSIHKL